MPVGNLSIDQALYLLTTHRVLFCDQTIQTHRQDRGGLLQSKPHDCFNGLRVDAVLLWDAEHTFLPTIETRAIVERVLHRMEWIDNSPNHQHCSGFASALSVHRAIEIALFNLEKASVKEAKPEVIKKEN